MTSSSELPSVEDGSGIRTRPCEWCGTPVQQPATGRTRLHCKRSHRQRSYEARRILALQDAAAAGVRAAVAAEADDDQAERVLAAARAQLAKADERTKRWDQIADRARAVERNQLPEPDQADVADVASAPAPQPEADPEERHVAPKPLRMPRKRALEVIAAAELVKADDWSETSRYLLRGGDIVLGVIAPDYSRLKRDGWSGVVHQTSLRTEKRATREQAAVALADSWLRQVTAKPRPNL